MTEKEISVIFKEVKEIVTQLKWFDKLPVEVQETIDNFADENYDFNFEISNGLFEHTASKEAYGIVILLYLAYISKDKNEEAEIRQIILNNP